MENLKLVKFILAIAMLVVIPMLSACSQQPQTPASAPASNAAGSKGGTTASTGPTGNLSVALSSLYEETFLPWNGGSMRQAYLNTIYEFLVYLDPTTQEPKPGLATKWEMSDEGKTWTFTLRQGVQFNEGNGELTSEDVKYTVERMASPQSTASAASELRDKITKVEAPEPHKVVFYLNKPDIDFIPAMASDAYQLLIVSKKYVEAVGDEKANAHPIGTGPYTLAEEHKKGGPIKLKTIENAEKHWRVKPQCQTITFLGVPEEATRVSMLKAGEVDLAPISYDSIETVKSSGLHIVSIPNNWVPVIRLGGLITTDPKRTNLQNPWAKKEVRQALNYAIDKEAIAKNIFKGEAKPAGGDLPINEWFDLKPYPYDPIKAKQLLAESGYPNGFQVTLKTYTTTPGAELPTIGEAVALYWKAIGIDVKIVPTDYGTVRGEWTGGSGKANNYTWTHRGMAFGSVVQGLQVDNNAKNNFATYVSKETDERLSQIEKETDLKQRSDLIKQFGEFLRDDGAAVFVVYANEPYGASKNVGQWPTPRIRAQAFEMITRP